MLRLLKKNLAYPLCLLLLLVQVLVQVLRSAGADIEGETVAQRSESVSFTDLYEAGLSGTPEASQNRAVLMQQLGLPSHLGKQGFLDALNILLTREEFLTIVDRR